MAVLPVDAILPDLRAALARRAEAVLVAPPGAGKTTRVAPALLDEPWVQKRRIVLLSPRRIAARAAAARMAGERGEQVGETVGYRVRLDSRVGPHTRIEVVTEGVFNRLILDDPELAGVAAVLFDEFHERSLEGDMGLALARDAQSALRPDLRLVVMSATLDAARVAALLDDAPVIACEGRMFPVTVHYRPRDPRAPLDREVATAAQAALRENDGSALVFLPGAREIERTAQRLRDDSSDANIDVRPLYGTMSPAEQDAAIAPPPPGRRKIVLATSVAETSLTIEGVRIVVDSGLSRRPRYEPSLGLSRLETVRASQAAIAQRAGRAGRLEPGVCIRLWSEGETRALPSFDRPEILDTDLSGLALDLAAWGVTDPEALTWLDRPPMPAWREARAMLHRIDALDDAGRLTEHGRMLARLPLPPRLAHMVVASATANETWLAAALAMLLTEPGLSGRDADLAERVNRFENERTARAAAARRLIDRIVRAAGGAAGRNDERRSGAVLARAYPDRIAKARGGGQFIMANGRAAGLDPAHPSAGAPFVVIAETSGAAECSRIVSFAPIDAQEVEAIAQSAIETKDIVEMDKQTGLVRMRRRRMLGRIVLSEAPIERPSGAALAAALLDAVREHGLSTLNWTQAARQVRARVAFLRARDGDPWPDWSDGALLADLQTWLGPRLLAAARLTDVDVASALLDTLPYDLRRQLDARAPARFETPAGSALCIDYESEGSPIIDVRLQELFGLDRHPSVGGVPLTLRLLSPARRPVQTTRDLPGFWRGSYAAVRSEMRGRYPKHPWPEDPLAAPPTRRAKPRGS